MTKEALNDLTMLCQEEGADVSKVSTKPLSLAALVSELEQLGLVKPSESPVKPPAPPPKPPGPPTKPATEPPNLEQSLSSNFQTDVR